MWRNSDVLMVGDLFDPSLETAGGAIESGINYGTAAQETGLGAPPGTEAGGTPPTPKPPVYGSGWPPARPFVAAAWRVTVDGPRYTLQSGDTFSGLSWTYLGDPARWKEISSLNPQHGPSSWPAGALIVMPDEAVAYAIQHGALPASAGNPNLGSGQALAGGAGRRKWVPWAIGGAAVVTVATVAGVAIHMHNKAA